MGQAPCQHSNYVATSSFALLKFSCLIKSVCLFRFHLLAEFDADKRSCRKRLDGHNRRRRKPQPDTMASASFITSQQGHFRIYQFALFLPSLYFGSNRSSLFPYLAGQRKGKTLRHICAHINHEK